MSIKLVVKVQGMADPIPVELTHAVVNLPGKIMGMFPYEKLAQDFRKPHRFADPMVHAIEGQASPVADGKVDVMAHSAEEIVEAVLGDFCTAGVELPNAHIEDVVAAVHQFHQEAARIRREHVREPGKWASEMEAARNLLKARFAGMGLAKHIDWSER
jgi:hypothetical protein